MKKNLIILLSFFFFQSNLSQTNQDISDAAMSIIDSDIIYNGDWVTIPYPNGDVPPTIGVCTDVIIRALRKISIDLQKEIHEDMKENFAEYPNNWGLTKPYSSMDHRRVWNQMKYFERQGKSLNITIDAENYKPGDIVAYDLGGGTTHIAIVVDVKSDDGERYQIVHNIGGGQVMEDTLFSYHKIIGHYRLF